MLTLREVQTDGAGKVPGLAVLVAFILVVICIMVLVWYVHHIGRKPRVSVTTAVQALDRLHDCLRQLVPRPFPDGRHRDDHGTERLITRVMSWDDYIHLAFDEIRMAGAGSPQIARRMRAVLEDLLSIAPVDRRQPLQQQLDLLQSAARAAMTETIDRKRSSRGDSRGLG